jgi:spore coat protein A
MLSRKGFIKLAAAGGASAYLATRRAFVLRTKAAQSPQMPLDPKMIPQFVQELPDLLDPYEQLIAYPSSQVELFMTEHQANVLPPATVPGYSGTWVWSYLQSGLSTRTSYLGPVIVAHPGVPIEIKFYNNLGSADSTNVLAYKYSTDQTLHWADPLNDSMNMGNHRVNPPTPDSPYAENYDGPIPACPHLHGGYVPAELDGGPDSWFTSDGSKVGKGYYSKDGPTPKNYCIYRYPSNQEPSLIWFHDHTLGATRLNVYCGLAGAYLIGELGSAPLDNFPTLVPIVIQDRMFDTNGQFFFPADSAGGELWALNPEHPYWVPEFIGDTIVVNGKAWPFMGVDPKRYTLMFINGSNARSYQMQFIDPVSKNYGPPLWMVGTDGGLLDLPVKVDPLAATNNKLVMMPGERYWAIVDFKNYAPGMIGPNGSAYSGKWILKNTAKAPYPGGESPNGATTGRIMQFVVAAGPVSDTSYDPSTGDPIRTPMIRLTNATIQQTRQLTLNEIALPARTFLDPVTDEITAYPGGPEEILVNNTKWSGERAVGTKIDTEGELSFDMQPIDSTWVQDQAGDYISEFPLEGTTELWEIVNLTMDAHPIHTHLAQFQLLNRQSYNKNTYPKAYAAAFPGGYDYTTQSTLSSGKFIPAFGPPLDYMTGNTRAIGGNPDITPYLQGKAQGPLPQENGWKDTVMAPPGMVTRFLVRWTLQSYPANTGPAQATLPFDPTGGAYVWHCHIVDHEDNEMMRPDKIDPQPSAQRTYIKGIDY